MRRQRIGAVLVVSMALGLGLSACAKQASEKTVTTGSVVTLQYVLTANNTPVILDDAPQIMKLTVGEGKFPTAFEKNLLGLKVGAAKAIVLKPEEAYGPERKELIARVPRSALPKGEIKEGSVLFAGTLSLKVVKILDDGSVIVDRNHPLAGKNLIYKVRISSIE